MWAKKDVTLISSNFHSQTKIFKCKTLPCFKSQLFTHFITFYFNSKHISLNLKSFFFIEFLMKSTNPLWLTLAFFIKNNENDFNLDLKNIFLHDFTCKFQLLHLCTKLDNLRSKIHFCTWNWLFGIHDYHFSFNFSLAQILMKLDIQVKNISKFIF